MKRSTAYWMLIVFSLLVLTGCSCKHQWTDANCVSPKTCSLCETTEGEPIGHSWADASCTAPKTCVLCGEIDGEALGHQWQAATCELAEICTRCEAVGAAASGHTYGEWECDGENFAHSCQNCGNAEVLPPEGFFMQLLTGTWRAKVYSNGSHDTLHPEDSITIYPDGTIDLALTQKVEFPETAQLVKEDFGYVEFPNWKGWHINFFIENAQWWDEMMGPDCPREYGLFLTAEYSQALGEGFSITLVYPGFNDMWIFHYSGIDFGEVPE